MTFFRDAYGDFEPFDDDYENDNTEALLEYLRERGFDVEGQPFLGKYGRPDGQIHRHSMGIKVFKDFIEAKSTLTSRAELERLKTQIVKYYKSGRFVGGRIFIYGDADEELLEDLNEFCFWFSTRYVVPFGIRVHPCCDTL